MSDEQQKVEIPGKPTATPKEHKLLLTGVGSQNLVVFSEQKGRILYLQWKFIASSANTCSS